MTTVVLVGPPNAGKTTFFNKITGSRSKTVNYPGSTVDINVGSFKRHADITVVDTPGLYSFDANSEDEQITLNALTGLKQLLPESNHYPDLIISVVDVCQLSRHLLLTKQLIDKGYPVIVLVSMCDCAEDEGLKYDFNALSEQLNCPVYRVNDVQANLDFKAIILKHSHANYSPTQCSSLTAQQLYDDIERLIDTIRVPSKRALPSFDLDRLFLHPLWGGLSFFLIMGLLFYSIFFLASPFMDAVEHFFSMINGWISALLPESMLRDMLTEGLVNGVASVLVFVPQIALLFFGIGVLESTGYLARGAVIADKPLSFMGLNGRCFVPLLSGFACAIPAMMATRNIQQSAIKRLCCFLIPLMQCSARLPVYGLLLALLFGKNFFLSSLLMIAIYLGSLIIAAIVALIITRSSTQVTNTRFTIELPKWRAPHWAGIFTQAMIKTKSFITGAGPIIMFVSVLFWLLSTYPNEEMSYAMMIGQFIEPIFAPMGVDWRVGVAILLSFVAREVFVSALVVLFSANSGESMVSLLKTATFQGSDVLIFNTPSIVSLILFFMIALQCGATFAMARSEMKSTKLATIQLVSYIGGAYVLSVLVFQLLQFF